MRPQQWVKNLFLFAALIFSGHLAVLHDLFLTTLGFLIFSALSSAIYLFNDTADAEVDARHPIKRKRPVASGELSPGKALTAATLLAAIGMVGGFALHFQFGVVSATYFALNVLYSLRLKEVVILDVMSVAAGFVLRVAGGAVLIQVPMSQWLIICTILLALFLGFSKRRAELSTVDLGDGSTRSVLGHYSHHFLDQMIGVVTATTVMSYTLYTISEETTTKFGTQDLIYTVPFVLYGIFRYLYLVHKKVEGEDPTKTILSDGPLLANLALWIVVAAWIIYRTR
jgi:4-hydroxybenzoate polyprenyltransferase